MPHRLIAVLLTIAMCVGAPAQGEGLSAAARFWDVVSKAARSRQAFQISQIHRTEQDRLESVLVAIEQLENIPVAEWDRLTIDSIERTLDSIEASLADLVDKFGAEPEVVQPMEQRIGCVRNVLQNRKRPSAEGRFRSDEIACASRSIAATVETAPAEAEEVMAVSVTADPSGTRYSYSLSIYGQSVDLDFGNLFALLSKSEPKLLQPLPIVHDYRVEKCVNRGFSPPVVFASAHKANAAFRKQLQEASDIWRFGEGVTRFTLVSGDLPEQLARTGLGLPDALEDFTIEEAETLITRDFAMRYGMDKLDDLLALSALRNLEQVLGQSDFLALVANILGKREVRPADVGPALAGLGRRGEDLWSVVYDQASRYLHCDDANQIFAAYDLVYRAGDYPAALKTLSNLEAHMGLPAVPGLSMNAVSHDLLVIRKPNCQEFGPVELSATEQREDLCVKGKVVVDGVEKYRVVAGGAEVRFFVNDAERDIIRAAIRHLEARDRGGDHLRWRDSTRLAIKTQQLNLKRGLGLTQPGMPDVLPCLVSLSVTDRFADISSAKQHIENYRRHFYPLTEAVSPDRLSYVFVIDAFDRRRNVDALWKELGNLPGEISGALASMHTMLAQQTASPAGSDATVGPPQPNNFEMVEKVCTLVTRQMEKIDQVHAGIHGELIKSLLVGGSVDVDGLRGVGLLNPAGAFAESDFLKCVQPLTLRALTKGELAWEDLITHLKDAPGWIERLRAEAKLHDDKRVAPAIVNLSLAREFVSSDDQKRIADLRDYIEYLDEDALLVVAAGQPPLDIDPDALQANAGRKLKFTRAHDARASDDDCPVFPACMSERKNVIAVGAVRPSKGSDGLKLPVVTSWANFGTAVTLGAPGEGILTNDLGFVLGGNDTTPRAMNVASLRDGTSFATVFVTAIAAEMAAKYPDLRASQIKKRLIATARPYLTPEGTKEFFTGNNHEAKGQAVEAVDGYFYAGVIDPRAALRDPAKHQVAFRSGPNAGKTLEFDSIELQDGVGKTPRLTVFTSTSAIAQSKGECRWSELYRIHLDRPSETNEGGHPIFSGALGCKDSSNSDQIQLVSGPLGTTNDQQNPCMLNDACLKGQIGTTWYPLNFAEIEDIYFAVVGR